MKNNLFPGSILGLFLMQSACCAEEDGIDNVPWNKAVIVKVEGKKGIAGAILLPEAKVKMMAEKLAYNAKTGEYTLSGSCSVTVIQDDGHQVRFEGNAATVQAPDIELQLDGGYPADLPYPTFGVLSDAVKSNPQISFFRLNWSVSMGSWGSAGTSLYDRKKRTLRDSSAGGDDTRSFKEKYVYTEVTEKMLLQLAGLEKQNTRAAVGGTSFESLVDLGAKRQKIDQYRNNRK